MKGYWFEPLGEFAHTLGPVVADDVSTGPCYRKFVKQFEECGIQGFEQAADLTFRVLLRVRPLREVGLRILHRLGNAVDAKRLVEGPVLILRDQQELISQILEAVIYRGCREQQHLGIHARLEEPVPSETRNA